MIHVTAPVGVVQSMERGGSGQVEPRQVVDLTVVRKAVALVVPERAHEVRSRADAYSPENLADDLSSALGKERSGESCESDPSRDERESETPSHGTLRCC
jgi:hypothetical protein